MPAAAVIPAPIVYIKVVAVKKLVVGFEGRRAGPPRGRSLARPPSSRGPRLPFAAVGRGRRDVYCEEIRVFKAGASAWIV